MKQVIEFFQRGMAKSTHVAASEWAGCRRRRLGNCKSTIEQPGDNLGLEQRRVEIEHLWEQ